MSSERIPLVSDLDELERRFQAAFRSGDEGPLEVIGYGEISSVVRWHGDSGPVAAKRLPNYPDPQTRREHRDLMAEYIATLNDRGTAVLPTEFYEIDTDEGSFVLYTIQPLIDPDRLAVPVLRNSPDEGAKLLESIIARTAAVVSDSRFGLDAQLSNWIVNGGGLEYLDISTPFMRDESTGLSRFDTSILVASLPWLLRWPVQRFVAESIVREYFDLRTVLVNAIANFRKEGLDRWIENAVKLASGYVEDPVTVEEIDRYYRKDRLMWAVLQRLRRLDRWWQLKVRRRPYPVLLPGRIDR